MKLTVKTLKGTRFEISVQPNDTVIAVKKAIEDVQGKDCCPCGQQLLIYKGKVLKDESTLAESNVSEEGFLVVMVSKSKNLGPSGTPSTQASSVPESGNGQTAAPVSGVTSTHEAPSQTISSQVTVSAEESAPSSAPNVPYGQAGSHVVASNNLEQTIQQIMDIGCGSWDRETVSRALRAAYNNPERAVDYLYSGIPEMTEVAVPATNFSDNLPAVSEAPAAPASGMPNSSPLDMFPQQALSGSAGDILGSLDFLRNNSQFQALRLMVQSNPQILQPMLEELGNQNPEVLRLIQEHHQEFLQLINEPADDSEGDIFDQSEQDLPQTISVTQAEQEAIQRLEGMGFDRALVIEAFLACDRNEELAANYLFDHAGEYED